MSVSGISSNSSLADLFKLLGSRTESSSSGQKASFEKTAATESTGSSDTVATDFSAFLQALTSANSALSQLIQDVKSSGSGASADSSTASASDTSKTSNPMANDLGALEKSLSSGDLGGAQNILSQIMQHMHRPHHAHHMGPPPDAGASQSTASTIASDSTSGSNTLANDFSALGNALSSGDQTSANSAFAQLMKDIQSTASTDSTGSKTASTSDTYAMSYRQNLEKLLNTWTSQMASAAQTSTISAFA